MNFQYALGWGSLGYIYPSIPYPQYYMRKELFVSPLPPSPLSYNHIIVWGPKLPFNAQIAGMGRVIPLGQGLPLYYFIIAL